MRPRSRISRMGLVLVAGHPSAASCHYLYLAFGGADDADRHGRDRMIGPVRHLMLAAAPAPAATPRPGAGGRVIGHWPAVRVHGSQATRRSSPERIAPAIAG